MPASSALLLRLQTGPPVTPALVASWSVLAATPLFAQVAPTVSVGGGVRTSFVHSEPAEGDSTDKFLLDSARLYFNGSVTPKIKFMFNTEYNGATNDVGVLDAVAQLSASPKLNLWVGRFLPPSDRANLYGPYYANHWNVYTDGLQNGHLHSVATDEVCCNLSVKVRGVRIDDVTGGNAGVEPRVAVIYTETVEKRGYPLEKFVDVVSSNAARILGLYPRKGAIAVGSDADIVVLDTSKRRTVRAQELHEADYSPWEGKEVAAWPSVTVLRGKVMVADGKFHGDLKDGQYLKRKISPAILERTK